MHQIYTEVKGIQDELRKIPHKTAWSNGQLALGNGQKQSKVRKTGLESLRNEDIINIVRGG